MIDLLYFWHFIRLMCKEGYRISEHLLALLKTFSKMGWWCVVSPKSISSDCRLFSHGWWRGARGGEERWRGGRKREEGKRGRWQWESEVVNGGVGAAIMMEKQYCRPVLSAIMLPFFMRNFIVHCIEHIDFFGRLVHNNSSKQHWALRCHLTERKVTNGEMEAVSSSKSLYLLLHS